VWSEVIVAVIDTGTYIDHPDLADHIWVNEAELYGEPGVDDDGNGYIDDIHGWDFYNNDNSVFDRMSATSGAISTTNTAPITADIRATGIGLAMTEVAE
jgi:subtilisin family serine protease